MTRPITIFLVLAIVAMAAFAWYEWSRANAVAPMYTLGDGVAPPAAPPATFTSVTANPRLTSISSTLRGAGTPTGLAPFNPSDPLGLLT